MKSLKDKFGAAWRFLTILVGAAIYAAAVELFYIAGDLTTGGLTGIALILNKLFSWPVGMLVIVMNVPLFLLGGKRIGKQFFFASLLGVGISSILIDIFAIVLPPLEFLQNDRLLCSVLAGVGSGVGLGLVMSAGGSTGGSDIIGLLISRSYEHLSVGRLIMTIDIVIVAANSIIFRDISAALYTGIAMYLSGVVIDSLMYGANIATVAFIVTKKTDEVNQILIKELDRGVTILNGTGGYTGAPQSVLICAVGRRQLTTLKRLVRQSDPNAFLILSEARDIIGAGFSDPLV